MNESATLSTLRRLRLGPLAGLRRVGIEWGVYGVPETFVIDKRGIIRSKIVGAITPKIVDERLLPLVRQLQAE